ncbi:MAG: hypothetical protein M3Q45_11705, partial [Chloroflexota bacterium]|nr:hypothetical protein [Chloroflexota bacterium]
MNLNYFLYLVRPAQRRKLPFLFTALTLFLLAGCTWDIVRFSAFPLLRSVTAPAPVTVEQPIVEIPLDGPLASRSAEFSGMAWYEDRL